VSVYLQGAMTTLFSKLQAISEMPETAKIAKNAGTWYDMSAEAGSSFIDIGSGFGKPVFHSAMQTGC
jgi:hypothetical protein